jgi:hypothetical protein
MRPAQIAMERQSFAGSEHQIYTSGWLFVGERR